MENKTPLSKISNALQTDGYSEAQISIIKDNVAKGTTNSELAYFLFVAKQAELSPLMKEIWCYKDGKNNLLVFAGRDGFLKAAQRNNKFNGIRSAEVREKDEFSLDIANNKITHIKNWKEKSNIIGAYAIAFRKDGEPTIEWCTFEEYAKTFGAWKTHPAEMIKKVAETHALKKAFGISNLQSEYDFEVTNNTVHPIDTNGVDMDRVNYAEHLIRNSTLEDEQREKLEGDLLSVNNTQLEEMISNLRMNQISGTEKPGYNQGDIQTQLDLDEDRDK